MALSVSDILKTLGQVPIWKNLRVLPDRVTALEARIDALERAAANPKRQPGQPCPARGAHALRRTSSVQSSGPFGPLGARDEIWTCEDCGQTDSRSNVKN